MEGVQYKFEGDKLILAFDMEKSYDKDADGVPSAKFETKNVLEIKGSELIEEMIGNVDLLALIKAKLGV